MSQLSAVVNGQSVESSEFIGTGENQGLEFFCPGCQKPMQWHKHSPNNYFRHRSGDAAACGLSSVTEGDIVAKKNGVVVPYTPKDPQDPSFAYPLGGEAALRKMLSTEAKVSRVRFQADIYGGPFRASKGSYLYIDVEKGGNTTRIYLDRFFRRSLGRLTKRRCEAIVYCAPACIQIESFQKGLVGNSSLREWIEETMIFLGADTLQDAWKCKKSYQ